MPHMEAEDLVRETLATYKRLSSYQDDGYVAILKQGQGSNTRTAFETGFLRPSLFRFQFSSSHPYPPLSHIITTHICGYDKTGAYMWTKHHDDPAKIEKYEDTLMVVAGATGISSGSAHTIAQLLIEDFRGGMFSSLSSVALGDDDVVDGTLCKSVRGTQPDAEIELTLSIDPVTMMIRRLRMQFAEFLSDEVRRNIRLNDAIEPSTFERPNGEI
jgi:hypothetical protein